MVKDPGAGAPINIDTRAAVGAVTLDVRGAMAADLGQAKMGEAIADAGGYLSQLAVKQMQAINVTKVAEAQDIMTEAESTMKVAMLKEPDELKWEGIATEHATQAQGRISKMALSPVAKQQVDSDFSRWQAHRTGQVKVDSARQSFDKVTTKVKKQLLLNMERQDPEGFTDNLQGGKQLGIFTDEDIEIEQIKYAERGKELAREKKIEAFNQGVDSATAVATGSGEEVALADLERGVLGEFDASEKEQIRNEIQRVSRGRALEDTDKIADLIAVETIKTPEEVMAFPSRHLRPADREALAADIMKRQAAAEKFRLSDSETQFAIMGNLLARADRWNKEAPDAEREYFNIHREALQLPEGLRGEITKPIAMKRAAKLPSPDDTLTDYTRNRLTRLFDRGMMGKFTVPGVGFNPKTGLKNPDTVNPEVEDQAYRVLAKTKRAMDRWLKINPNADETAIDAKMAELMVKETDKKQAAEILQEIQNTESPPGLIPQPPTGGPSDYVENVTTGKVTKFGYELDPNKDPLSAKRIAAFSGSTAIAAANAGEDHPDLLKTGDLAVSPDIEKELLDAGVKPKEIIRIKFKDGTTRTARWMDVTATDKQAAKLGLKPLRGRWDFFTPDGKESRDGMPVISFSRIASPK
jgi:hypothetical protein